MKPCDCNFNSEIANIIDPKKGTNNKISIHDYLNDIKLQQKVENKELILSCENGNELIKYRSDKRKCHFKHKSPYFHITEGMTQWHINWDFEKKEVIFKEIDRIADAVVDNNILEFQHSRYSSDAITERTTDYLSIKKDV